MKKIIAVGDDFGFCSSVNDGCIEAYKKGAVRELSLMLKSPGTQDAIIKAKQHDIKNIGLHCLLVFWEDRGTLARRDDYKKLFSELSKDKIIELFHKEVALFEKTLGKKPTHINGHYSIHAHDKLRDAVLMYCREYNIPLRLPDLPMLDADTSYVKFDARALVLKYTCRSTDDLGKFIAGSYQEVQDNIRQFLNRSDIETGEIMLHPGFISDELRELSSMVEDRERDLQISKWLQSQYTDIISDFAALPQVIQ